MTTQGHSMAGNTARERLSRSEHARRESHVSKIPSLQFCQESSIERSQIEYSDLILIATDGSEFLCYGGETERECMISTHIYIY